jgi:hypothetical protein
MRANAAPDAVLDFRPAIGARPARTGAQRVSGGVVLDLDSAAGVLSAVEVADDESPTRVVTTDLTAVDRAVCVAVPGDLVLARIRRSQLRELGVERELGEGRECRKRAVR